MAEQLKEQLEKASDKARDFLKNQDEISADDIKKKFNKSLKKSTHHLEEVAPSQMKDFYGHVRAQPLGAVLLSLLTGFILGRVSK